VEHILRRASTRTRLVAAALSSCACRSPVTMTHRAAAHLHVGDLANVPSIHRLVESTREMEHALRHASTRTRLLTAP